MTKLELGFIHRFVPGTHERTLLLLHGTGGNEDDLIGLGSAVAPGWSLLSPRGRVLEGGMPRFFRRLAEGVFDEADLVLRAGELARFITSAAAAYDLDPSKLVALGYSNGANIASAMMILHPETVSAAALLRPMIPFTDKTPSKLDGKSVLLASGAADPIAPPYHGERLEMLFQEAGAHVTRKVLPVSHGLSQADLTATTGWLKAL